MAAMPQHANDETELRRLLKHLDRMHAQTLAQLDRTDHALDAALTHFALRRGRNQRTPGAREQPRTNLPR
jgi:hypothetical protein